MDIREAKKIMTDFYNHKKNPTEEDEFMFVEAMEYLISVEPNPDYMLGLGGYYYEIKRFDLALKYYEMAASYDYDPAYECLGYIWYYGRTGVKDYEKAFEYFSKLMNKGNITATYKVADMYKNGYGVEQSYDKYVELVEKCYPLVKDSNMLFDPLPEVFTRLAGIRAKQERPQEAIQLYRHAKWFLEQRIYHNSFFGNLSIMKHLVYDLYELTSFPYDDFDLYDTYYLLKTPNKITFKYDGGINHLESVLEGDECVIHFNDTWYHNVDDFFSKAQIGDDKLVTLYSNLYDFEVSEDGRTN